MDGPGYREAVIHRWAALGLVLSVAACSGGGGEPRSAGTPPVTTAPPSASATATAGATAPGTPVTPGATTSAGTTATPFASGESAAPGAAGGGTPAPGSTGRPGAPRVAAEGTYPVAVAGSESFGPTGGEQSSRKYPATSTLEITAGETAQERTIVVRYSPERDDTITADVSRGAVRLVRSVARVAVGMYEQSTAFAPTPPIVLLPSTPTVGEKFGGRFSGEQSGSYSGKVLRRERIVVGGERVDALVVEERVTFSGDADGTITTVTWWDPVLRLPLKQKRDMTVTTSGATYEQHVTVTMTRREP